MSAETEVRKKSKAHTIYKLDSGVRVPGVTTVLGILNKPALVKWANNLGLQGIDSNKYVDNLADVGTLAHKMILNYFNRVDTDTADYSPNQVELAENCLMSFWAWEREHDLVVIMAEVPLVSHRYNYGGTIDCYCNLDGKMTLLDFKTGKAIYPEMFYQLAAYKSLLTEIAAVVGGTRILRIGRNADEGFEEQLVDNLDKQFEIFEHCLAIYNLKKETK